MTFWRQNLCCMPFRYYLLNCENVTCLVLIKVIITMKIKILLLNFICKSIYFTRFNSCRTVCFFLNIGSLYPFTIIYCQEKKGQFSIFTNVLKCSPHSISSKLYLFKNDTQQKFTCHSSLLTSWFQRRD